MCETFGHLRLAMPAGAGGCVAEWTVREGILEKDVMQAKRWCLVK